MTSIEIIRLVAPEFQDVDDDVLGKWVELVSPLVSKKRFGKLYEQAIALLVCHKLKMAGLGADDSESSGGSSSISSTLLTAASSVPRLSSISAGALSVGFESSLQGSSLTADAEYGMTSYGMQYLALRRNVIIPITCSGEQVML